MTMTTEIKHLSISQDITATMHLIGDSRISPNTWIGEDVWVEKQTFVRNGVEKVTHIIRNEEPQSGRIGTDDYSLTSENLGKFEYMGVNHGKGGSWVRAIQ